MSPADVELGPSDIVQPDIYVVLNAHLDYITPSHLIGTPDLVVEVASPGTARYDMSEKLNAYAHAGVPEYWIVNPDAHTIEILKLEGSASIRLVSLVAAPCSLLSWCLICLSGLNSFLCKGQNEQENSII